ncbi:hypothetical protein CWR48_13840 [Oceanobacillus arenosus]|uniref:HTH tetR-type domain-containing protein n=1 Tax=Oceanobacillus arenosus TaxID=1229153 RepID=A0A3D8PNP8_9BACI|nr:TetR/AcrR family transcriptional regulator [Oceanobacillus arenosus]RDW17594.1 hypothetical protein CWR48_13840 [Oceanobacillus arenosus]
MNRKKEKIIDAAHKLFIGKGFSATSIQDILDEAQIAKGTFYNYFTSKNECLMAILEYVQEEWSQRRKELEQGKESNDEEVFIAQVAARMNVDRKHHLLALFSSITFSEDEELRSFLEKQHLIELQWIRKRMIELNGEKTEHYAWDHATIFEAIVHHFINVGKFMGHKDMAPEDIIRYTLNRMKPLIKEQQQSKEVLLPLSLHSFISEDAELNIRDIEKQTIQLLEELVETLDNEENGNANKVDYPRFLLEELKAEVPRLFLLESVLISMVRVFEGSNYERKVTEISQMTWVYIEQTKRAN